MRFRFDPLITKQALRPMVKIKSATDTPDFKLPSRQANGGLKDKQMGDFILIMGLSLT